MDERVDGLSLAMFKVQLRHGCLDLGSVVVIVVDPFPQTSPLSSPLFSSNVAWGLSPFARLLR